MFNPERSVQNYREFVEGGGLAGLNPSFRAAHVSHAGGSGMRVDASDVFVDEFRLVAGGLDASRLRDQDRASTCSFRGFFHVSLRSGFAKGVQAQEKSNSGGGKQVKAVRGDYC